MQSSLNLDNLLSCQRDISDKSGLGYQKNTNEILIKYPCASEKQKQKNYFVYKPIKHSASNYPHGIKPKRIGSNPKGPKLIWVPKCILPSDTGKHDSSKNKVRMVSRQWLLKAYDRRKEFIPEPVTC